MRQRYLASAKQLATEHFRQCKMKISNIYLSVCKICLLLCASAFGLSGCFSLYDTKQVSQQPRATNLGSAEYYTNNLANELFADFPVNKHQRYAVATFVPVTNMQVDLSAQSPLMLLGHQLEQGLITEAVRRGLVAQDFKATNSIILGSDYDKALSRDLTHLSEQQKIDYYITGTITAQQNGAMVNARIINVRNKDVVAAATSFFPIDLFWESEQVMMRNGQIYRTEKR